MEEEGWLTSIEPTLMRGYLRGKVSDRKLRLFAVACCRRIWKHLADERSRKAVEVAELYADGLVDRERLVAARDEAREVKRFLKSLPRTSIDRAANAAFDVTRDTGSSAANNASAEAARALNFEDGNVCNPGELREQANLFRCIFGNPFRPATLDPAWLTPNVITLAQAIYDDRSFKGMPILGDALEEVGCDTADILAHCRSECGHVRGCWVIDAVLGKS